MIRELARVRALTHLTETNRKIHRSGVIRELARVRALTLKTQKFLHIIIPVIRELARVRALTQQLVELVKFACPSDKGISPSKGIDTNKFSFHISFICE